MITQYLMKKVNIYNSFITSSNNSNELNSNNNQQLNDSINNDATNNTIESTAMISVLNCIQCHQILGLEDDIFQVPGALGSIGAYVNPHG